MDLQTFAPREKTGLLCRQLGLPAEARLVLGVGQIGLRKGWEVAMTAFANVASRIPGVHFLVVGHRTSEKLESRQYEAELHATASGGSLAGRVHFLGYRQDMPHLLGECDILLHMAHEEPLGRVLLEAAGAGLPVVATAVGGTREIFPHEGDGALLVEVGDAGSAAGQIIALLEDEPRRVRLGRAARRRAAEAFDVRQAAAGLVAEYQALTRGPPSGPAGGGQPCT